MASKYDIIKYTQDDIKNVRKYFKIDEKKIKQSIEILKNWLKQQQHLPQNADDDFLERMLLRNKFRIEQTKEKLDDYYTLRGLYPDYILKDFHNTLLSKEIGRFLPLPKLTKSQERIILMYKTIDDLDVMRYLGFMTTLHEFLIYNDYNIGERYILNLENLKLNDLTGMTISRLANFYKLYTRAYSGRLLSIDLINPPPHANIFINLMKMVLPAKIQSRIRVHNNLESLHKLISKEYLPADLGGDLETIEKLTEKMDEIYVNQRNFFDKIINNVSNEKLRIGNLPKNELYGIEGNFKKLDID